MRMLALTRGMETMVDDEDYEWAVQFRWSAREGRRNSFYAARTMKLMTPDGGFRRTSREMQRDLMDPNMERGRELLVDHEDGNTLNNCRYNLRWSTPSQSNAHRAGFKSASGFKGVYLSDNPSQTNPWRVRVSYGGRDHYGRQQPDPVSGAREYNRLATELFGEFSGHKNIIPGDE